MSRNKNHRHQTIKLSTDPQGRPEFDVQLSWGNQHRTRRVVVLDPHADIRDLMIAITNGETDLTSDPVTAQGVIADTAECGRIYALAHWYTLDEPLDFPDYVAVTTIQGTVIVDPEDPGIEIEVEAAA